MQNSDYKIEITIDAKMDIRASVDHIKNVLMSPTAADTLLQEMKKLFSALQAMPTIYALCNNELLRAQAYRKALVKNYLVFYKVDENKKMITVLRVLHQSRNYEALLK